jgi:hypothetical protein
MKIGDRKPLGHSGVRVGAPAEFSEHIFKKPSPKPRGRIACGRVQKEERAGARQVLTLLTAEPRLAPLRFLGPARIGCEHHHIRSSQRADPRMRPGAQSEHVRVVIEDLVVGAHVRLVELVNEVRTPAVEVEPRILHAGILAPQRKL